MTIDCNPRKENILQHTSQDVPLQLGSKGFQTNLLTLGLDGIDVILGMH
jgi:hypothetical protein